MRRSAHSNPNICYVGGASIMAMFEGGFIPGFFHFFTMNLFNSDPINWFGLLGYIGAGFWIAYRIRNRPRDQGGSGGGGRSDYSY